MKMAKTWKIMSLVLTLALVCGMLFGCTPTPVAEATAAPAEATPAPAAEATPEPAAEPVTPGGELPRNETLYFGGLQWGRAASWSPYCANPNNSMAVVENPNARVTCYETLYMYNMLDGKHYPLLADGDFKWNAEMTQVTVKIKPIAKWSDGTPVTAEDVAYTFATHMKYESPRGLDYKGVVDKVEAVDPSTVVISATLKEDGTAVNPLKIVEYLDKVYVTQKAFVQKVEARSPEKDAFDADPCEDFVGSGPYKFFYSDDQKLVLIRDDNYWGKDASMWGKLPVPKYLAHTIYTDNAATQVAFAAGQVDVDQQYIENIQNMWEKQGLPISTYMDKAPYGVCASIPTAWFNLASYGLDQVAVRKAIAMAVDYDAIIANAMTNQSPTFKEVPRSMMLPTPGEQAAYDHDAVKDLQWVGNDIEGAKKLLDDAGIKDSDGDGWREFKGKKLAYNACCPNGWTDWQAAIEIVAAAGKNIGIDITTNFPEAAAYLDVVFDGTQTEYDIFMMWVDGSGPTQPWMRVRQFLSSEFADKKNNSVGNYGGYINKRADEIIQAIPTITDPAKLKELYTEAVKIYLTDVPSFGLMYRPEMFHAVNESVWTSFPAADDGLNIPPQVMINGYGIAGLYNLELVK